MTFTLGKVFRIHIFGESHGNCVGVSIEGCPPGLEIDTMSIQKWLNRRRPGCSDLSSARKEGDQVSIVAGMLQNRSTGAPVVMIIPNTDVDSSYYERIKNTPRPGHADYAARIKYGGNNDYRGGGVFSGRMTAAMVAAGGVAKQLLTKEGIEVIAHVVQIGGVKVGKPITDEEIRSQVYESDVRCADSSSSAQMESAIARVKEKGDSIGGVIECRVLGVPVGLGEPFFDSVESVLAHAMFSIPGVKGIEFGSGFSGASSLGSENNDPIVMKNGEIDFLKNDAGGILGGMSNGQPTKFKVAFKPTPSIAKPQKTVNLETLEETTIHIKGRHDPCIVPRALVVVQSLAEVVFADLLLRLKLRESPQKSGPSHRRQAQI